MVLNIVCMTNETWKPIKNYEGLYEISSLGNVKSLEGKSNHKKSILLKPYIGKDNYYQVKLQKNKKIENKRINRLVAEAFIPNPKNKPQVNHIDCNKMNNNVDNLEWVTESENAIHSYKFNKKRLTGVNQYTLKDKFLKKYESLSEAARETKIKYQSIQKVCKGEYKQAGGYIWRYVDEKH